MTDTIDLKFPTDWAQLTQPMLLHIYTCIAAGYAPQEIKACALMRWNKLQVLCEEEDHTYLIQKDHKKYRVSSQKMAQLLPMLDYLTQMPSTPIRLEEIKGHQALPADFQEVPFEMFIMCDNLYQGYIHMHLPSIMEELAALLYSAHEPIHLTKAQEVSIFYWWTALKGYLSRRFPHFLSSAPADGSALGSDLYRRLSDSMNAQIRALTKGDITKEKEVLSMDTWRALTELDAQSKEYQDLKQIYKK